MAETLQQNCTRSDPPSNTDRTAFELADIPRLLACFARWCGGNPAQALLLGVLAGIVGYAYFGIKAFSGMEASAATWIATGWNSENDQQHCWGIIPVAVALVLFRWREIAATPKRGASSGLWFVGAGLLLFVIGARCAEARHTIFALPLLCYGATRFLFGVATARIVLFPCLFLLFMTPLGGIVQGTVWLQLLTAKAISALSSICGIAIVVDGSSISSPEGYFPPMEVAGGCSGIRSLMAMSTIAALYAYFTMRGPIRGTILFCGSLLFAVLGNFARVFSVVLFARFFDAETATGLYHDYSGFAFFPVAIVAMAGFGTLLNRDWRTIIGKWFATRNGKQADADTIQVPVPAPKMPESEARQPLTTVRLATLVVLTAPGFATLFLLPKNYHQPNGIRMELPDFVGNWKGTDVAFSEGERSTLGEASGTRFARRIYRNLDGYEITVSIVLSGHDMSTSIHRPERCLRAQGWTLQGSDTFGMSLSQWGTFPITQLRSTHSLRMDDRLVTRELQTFYWFVGERDICADHWLRTAIDSRDRLFRGVSQRWAFILVSGAVPLAQNPNQEMAVREWSQATIRQFIKTLAPKIHLDSVKYH